MDDQALVAAMLGRDPAGLEAAYRQYADRLYAYSRSMLHDPEAAADVVQDTFVLASQRIGQLRDPDRLRPWLYAIARHECHRVLRSRASVASAPVPDRAAETPDPGTGVATEQVRELVAAALVGLSDSDREVIELAIRHDLSAPDVGAVLGVPVNHAHALLSRARSQLKRALSALLLARSGGGDCSYLASLLSQWDGRLTTLLRKRIGRHAETCPVCGDRQQELMRPESLLPAYAALPFAAVAETLRQRAAVAPAPDQSGASTADQPSGASTPDPPSGDGRRPARGQRGKRAVTVAAAGVVAVLVLGFAVVARATSQPASPVAAATASPLATSLAEGAPGGGLTAPRATLTDSASSTVSSSPTDSTSPGGNGSSDPLVLVIPDLSGPPTATPRPDFTVTVDSSKVACQGSSYTLRVVVTAAGAALSEAYLYWQADPSSVPARNQKLTRVGQSGHTTLLSLQHAKLVWWVAATATDGRTAKTAPVGKSNNPCSSIGGFTT